MVIVLLFAAECQLGALIKLVGITFPRDIHHDEVFSCGIKLIWATIVVVSMIDAHIAVVAVSSDCTII